MSINNKVFIEEEEIDVIKWAKKLWVNRRTIYLFILVFMFIGFFVAIFTKNEYTAKTTILPQSESGSTGGLGGLAAIAGVKLSGSSNTDIPPSLFPKIVNSIGFKKELLKTEITFSELDKKVSFEEYFRDIYKPSVISTMKKYTIGLPGILIGLIKGVNNEESNNNQIEKSKEINLIQVSADENSRIKQLNSRVSMDVNTIDGYITISAVMPEARASAELVSNFKLLLQKYIIALKIQKSQEKLLFIEKQYNEREKIFKKSQDKFASFQDRNQYTNSALVSTRKARLKSENDMAYEIYLELAKQLENQKIKVKEDTPIFTVLEEITIPLEKSKPRRGFIVIVYTFLGAFLGVIFVFFKLYSPIFKENWRKS
ncbi:G-rich domain on putative tyrosine kinase [Lutibacter oricola]|uniref:G-rich domain on putative tyrosine kinase n=1 Tax=Lutibacter oricola TaxID=762486 RepID=A0A1H2TNB5_9FLAO|nr:Wzz/FepE/Etk N-terminal domain-containing protein [Lutibacter oricola]SDW45340.1 G-rich domain on putative tyrosine kinase [Lutibacter oricola]